MGQPGQGGPRGGSGGQVFSGGAFLTGVREWRPRAVRGYGEGAARLTWARGHALCPVT